MQHIDLAQGTLVGTPGRESTVYQVPYEGSTAIAKQFHQAADCALGTIINLHPYLSSRTYDNRDALDHLTKESGMTEQLTHLTSGSQQISPQFYEEDTNQLLYLMEDMGEKTAHDYFTEGNHHPAKGKELIELLALYHNVTSEGSKELYTNVLLSDGVTPALLPRSIERQTKKMKFNLRAVVCYQSEEFEKYAKERGVTSQKDYANLFNIFKEKNKSLKGEKFLNAFDAYAREQGITSLEEYTQVIDDFIQIEKEINLNEFVEMYRVRHQQLTSSHEDLDRIRDLATRSDKFDTDSFYKLEKLVKGGMYTIIHGDPNYRNIMITEKGERVFIDPNEARLGNRAEDLVNLTHNIFPFWTPSRFKGGHQKRKELEIIELISHYAAQVGAPAGLTLTQYTGRLQVAVQATRLDQIVNRTANSCVYTGAKLDSFFNFIEPQGKQWHIDHNLGRLEQMAAHIAAGEGEGMLSDYAKAFGDSTLSNILTEQINSVLNFYETTGVMRVTAGAILRRRRARTISTPTRGTPLIKLLA